jgi:hypothetical protein
LTTADGEETIPKVPLEFLSLEDTQALGERTPEQWQQDAFGQIDALLRALALRG